MAAIGTYYFDGTTLANATSVYTNAALTTLAADGYYSDAGIVRQQVNGVLLNAQQCNSCAVACGSSVSASSNGTGLYTASVDLANSTGAVVFYAYLGASIPDGIKLTFNSVVTNKFTCYLNHVTPGGAVINDGNGTQVDYAGINNASDAFTYMGRTNADLMANTPYNGVGVSCPTEGGQLEGFVLSGGTYQSNGVFQNVSVNNNMIGTNPNTARAFTAVVPKTTLTPTVLTIEISAPLCGTFFDWQVACPVALHSFQGSALQGNTTCAADAATYYFAHNADYVVNNFVPETGAFPAVGNWIFEDANGVTPVGNAGIQYIIHSNTTFLGVRNGIVVSTGACV